MKLFLYYAWINNEVLMICASCDDVLVRQKSGPFVEFSWDQIARHEHVCGKVDDSCD